MLPGNRLATIIIPLSDAIQSTDGILGGQLCVGGHRFSVAQLIAQIAEDERPAEIAVDFDMPVTTILACLNELSCALLKRTSIPATPPPWELVTKVRVDELWKEAWDRKPDNWLWSMLVQDLLDRIAAEPPVAAVCCTNPENVCESTIRLRDEISDIENCLPRDFHPDQSTLCRLRLLAGWWRRRNDAASPVDVAELVRQVRGEKLELCEASMRSIYRGRMLTGTDKGELIDITLDRLLELAAKPPEGESLLDQLVEFQKWNGEIPEPAPTPPAAAE